MKILENKIFWGCTISKMRKTGFINTLALKLIGWKKKFETKNKKKNYVFFDVKWSLKKWFNFELIVEFLRTQSCSEFLD